VRMDENQRLRGSVNLHPQHLQGAMKDVTLKLGKVPASDVASQGISAFRVLSARFTASLLCALVYELGQFLAYLY
ncbi:MAG: hypothetical protein AAGA67_03550, partial [Cyanobacteria bacterium P01_F01_bin.153]